MLEHRVSRPRTRGLIGEVEPVAVEAVSGRERHVQPAVALALGPLLVDPVHVLHVEAAPFVALAPQHVVDTCHTAAEAWSEGGGAGWRTRAASARAAEAKGLGGGEAEAMVAAEERRGERGGGDKGGGERRGGEREATMVAEARAAEAKAKGFYLPAWARPISSFTLWLLRGQCRRRRASTTRTSLMEEEEDRRKSPTVPTVRALWERLPLPSLGPPTSSKDTVRGCSVSTTSLLFNG